MAELYYRYRGGKTRKTIKSILRKKVNDWLKSIEDEQVRNLAQQNTIVTGGSIASMLIGEDVNDFDIYFKTVEATDAVANYYVDKIRKVSKLDDDHIKVKVESDRVEILVKSAGVAGDGDGDGGAYQFFETSPDIEGQDVTDYVDAALKITDEEGNKDSYRALYVSSNCISLSDKVQLIIRFCGDPDQIHENYDFVHCTNYWTAWDNNLVLRTDAMESLLSKNLRYQGSLYPLCSIIRTRKFIKRGWHVNAGQFVKMAMQLNNMDLTDTTVLQEQLTGVDVAYFQELIRLVEKGRAAGKEIDATYICELVDGLF